MSMAGIFIQQTDLSNPTFEPKIVSNLVYYLGDFLDWSNYIDYQINFEYLKNQQ